MDFATSYFGSRILRHVVTDMQRLREDGFSVIVHTLSENDFQYYRRTMADIVAATKDAGLDVWIDPWGLGAVFGGEAFSRVALHEPSWLQQASDGTRLPACCPNNPEFRNFVAEWIIASCGTEADAIFWDEPHFFSDHTGKTLGCSCKHCRALAEETEFRDAQMIRGASLTSFLGWACSRVQETGKKSVICLLPPARPDEGRTNWEAVASAKGLHNLGTDPFWVTRGEDPEICITRFGSDLISVASRASLKTHIWIQGFGIPAGREDEITRAVLAAGNLGTDLIAIWGFDACESMSYLACERPTVAWQAFLKGMSLLSE